jgi:hypothetical protein
MVITTFFFLWPFRGSIVKYKLFTSSPQVLVLIRNYFIPIRIPLDPELPTDFMRTGVLFDLSVKQKRLQIYDLQPFKRFDDNSCSP